jgi:urease accessory protein
MTAPAAGAAALLALADQRLPVGGHAHSGGVEEAMRGGLVADGDGLRQFLRRRLLSVGRVGAGIAAAAAGSDADGIRRLDAETDARTPSPAQRAASRSQGHGLLRLARPPGSDPTSASPGPTSAPGRTMLSSSGAPPAPPDSAPPRPRWLPPTSR